MMNLGVPGEGTADAHKENVQIREDDHWDLYVICYDPPQFFSSIPVAPVTAPPPAAPVPGPPPAIQPIPVQPVALPQPYIRT